jgi:hypothetical protein
MPQNTTHVYQDFFALDEHERPACTVTPAGEEYLRDEEQEARRAWINALISIPARPGKRRTSAVARTLKLREEYERLIGHKAGHPPADD